MKTIPTFIACALFANSLFAVDAYWKGTAPIDDVAQNTDWNGTKFWADGVVPNNTADTTYDVYFDVDKMPQESFTSTGSVADMSGWGYKFTVNSITFNGRPVSKINSGGTGDGSPASITTIGDFKKLGVDTSVTICRGRNVDFNVAIGGDLVIGVDKNIGGGTMNFGGAGGVDRDWEGALRNVTVAKDVYIYSNSLLNFNVHSGSGSFENPDVDIKGVIKAIGVNGVNNVWLTGAIQFLSQERGLVSDSYIRVGGISGHMQVVAAGGATNTMTEVNIAHVMFTNAAGIDVTLSGQIYDSYNTKNLTKLGFVMNGDGIQRINSDKIRFTGGVEMRKGTLTFEASKIMWGNSTYSESNHGDLIMSGGNLVLKNSQSEGVMGFENLIYEGGTIILNVGVNGTTRIQLAGTMGWGVAAISDKVLFDFTGTPVDLVGEENKAKIVGWEVGNAPTGFEDTDFSANNITVLDQEYMAVFQQLSDGLYVYYTEAIPEPAVFAALLGIFALGLVLRRRNAKVRG